MQNQHLSVPQEHHPHSSMEVVESCYGDVFHQQALRNWSELRDWWMLLNIVKSLRENQFQFSRYLRNFNFKQDSDSKHTCEATLQQFKERYLNVLEWPSQSPDINPNRNLWHDLKIFCLKLFLLCFRKTNMLHLQGCCHFV